MKLPLSWIREYADIEDISPKAYADALTMSGSKVEGLEEMGAEIQKVVIGKILTKEHHENADTLWICGVDTGEEEPLQIVTAAQNMNVGDTVPVALSGASLIGGIRIKASKLRGVLSQGMFCSHEELGLAMEDVPGACEDGIILFPKAHKPGTDVKDVLGLRDVVVDFEITSNRPDCLSAIGLGRETAATFGVPFHKKAPAETGNAENAADFVSVDIRDKALCTRYIARVVKDIKIAPSPKWMRDRLAGCGVRPINNIVDITNYVMLEYGQPMHAFDRNFLKGQEIIVRRAENGEKLTTLDGVERQLTADMLVIADRDRAVAVAGVMGGENSEIQSDTKEVIFEAAMFDGASVRKTAKALGLRTESSARFEKGLDKEMPLEAVNRACELVELLGAGTVVGGMIDIYPEKAERRRLPLCPEKINAFLGTGIPKAKMEEILTAIGFEIDGEAVLVPTYRADIEEFADVAEEIARFYGYNNISSTLMRSVSGVGGRSRTQQLEEKIADTLAGLGFYETMTTSFVHPDAPKMLGRDEACIRILNPLGEENSAMRTSLLNGSLEVLARNANQRAPRALIFEIGKVYKNLAEDTLAEEPKMLSVGGYGLDFFQLKGSVEAMLGAIGVTDYAFERAPENATFHPGKTAVLKIAGQEAGLIGEIHPLVRERFALEQEVYLGEFTLSVLLEAASAEKTYKPLGRYPAVNRDLAVLVDAELEAASVEKVIRQYAGGKAEEIRLFDVYCGKQVPEGKKSMAYTITFRAADKTLSDEEVTKITDKILRMLEKELGAVLR